MQKHHSVVWHCLRGLELHSVESMHSPRKQGIDHNTFSCGKKLLMLINSLYRSAKFYQSVQIYIISATKIADAPYFIHGESMNLCIQMGPIR